MRRYTMDQIKRENSDAGFHWFEPGALRFFHSRVSQIIYQGTGGIYFVSSEQMHYDTPRKYSVRQFFPEAGNMGTVGEFHSLTKSVAHRIARDASKGVLADKSVTLS